MLLHIQIEDSLKQTLHPFYAYLCHFIGKGYFNQALTGLCPGNREGPWRLVPITDGDSQLSGEEGRG